MNYRELNRTGFKPTLKIFKHCLKNFKHINTKYPQAVGLCRNPSRRASDVGDNTQSTQPMYIPRGKLLALVTIVVAASLVTATGAFSSVTAERTTKVKVAGDSNAFLALDGNTDGPNGEYVKMKDNKKLSIDLTKSSEGAKGVNPDAVTTFDNLFTITNQGSQPVTIKLTPKGNNKEAVKFYKKNGDNIKKETIDVGTTIQVGIKVDTTKGNYEKGAKLIDSIVIKATSQDANEKVIPDKVGTASSGSSGDSKNKQNARLAAPA